MPTIDPNVRKNLIAKKAEELYEKRGRTPGRELDDWLEAERLVDQELRAQSRESKTRVEPPKPRLAPTPARSAPQPSGKAHKVKRFSR